MHECCRRDADDVERDLLALAACLVTKYCESVMLACLYVQTAPAAADADAASRTASELLQ